MLISSWQREQTTILPLKWLKIMWRTIKQFISTNKQNFRQQDIDLGIDI